MTICFPVEENKGLESAVYGHFGSAPMFLVVDSETHRVEKVINRDRDHRHGACRPLKALGGQTVDAIVVGGIGAGALNGLNQAGFKVYQAASGTVEENLQKITHSQLTLLSPEQTCGGHRHHCGDHDHDPEFEFGCGF